MPRPINRLRCHLFSRLVPLSSNSLPLLAAGGGINSSGTCANPNIFIYSLNTNCQRPTVDAPARFRSGEPICTTLSPLTQGAFDSNVVNSVKWCCNVNSTCPSFPYLAVGGKTSTATPPVNTRIYYISPSDYSLNSLAYASTNSLTSVSSVAWNPSPCNCTDITVGGCQDPENPSCNIITYQKNKGIQLLTEIAQITYDTNVTSIDWCKPITTANNICAYLAVGTTGTTASCPECLTSPNQVAVYQATFCTNTGHHNVCQR